MCRAARVVLVRLTYFAMGYSSVLGTAYFAFLRCAPMSRACLRQEMDVNNGWETVWYSMGGLSLVVGLVGFWNLPDTTITTWALEEAQKREQRREGGLGVEPGRNYAGMARDPASLRYVRRLGESAELEEAEEA